MIFAHLIVAINNFRCPTFSSSVLIRRFVIIIAAALFVDSPLSPKEKREEMDINEKIIVAYGATEQANKAVLSLSMEKTDAESASKAVIAYLTKIGLNLCQCSDGALVMPDSGTYWEKNCQKNVVVLSSSLGRHPAIAVAIIASSSSRQSVKKVESWEVLKNQRIAPIPSLTIPLMVHGGLYSEIT
uniref:Uncharacterized protein n=1 Tax=Romanomermis culicivorax TaxID=13658 RepID=A0A915HGY4_ROMCU